MNFKRLLFWSKFKQNQNMSRNFSTNPKMQNLIKMRPVEVTLSDAGGQTNTHDKAKKLFVAIGLQMLLALYIPL